MSEKEATSDSGIPSKRVTKHELRRRIEYVRVNLLAGKTRNFIVTKIMKNWAIKPVMAYGYVKKAEREIQSIVKPNQQAWLAEHICVRRDIRRRANKKGDLRMELAAAESEAVLLGLNNEGSGSDDLGPTIKEVHINLKPGKAKADAE